MERVDMEVAEEIFETVGVDRPDFFQGGQLPDLDVLGRGLECGGQFGVGNLSRRRSLSGALGLRQRGPHGGKFFGSEIG